MVEAVNTKKGSPIFVPVKKRGGRLKSDCFALCNRIRVVNQNRCREINGTLAPETMKGLEKALRLSLGLAVWRTNRI